MANQLLTIQMITRESAMVLENNLTLTKFIRRDLSKEFGIAGAKIGTVLNVRKPPRYLGRTGQGLSIEDAIETTIPLTLNVQRGVDVAFTSQDLALSIDDFSERFLHPNISKVANGIDYDVANLYAQVFNEVGTPGTVPNALLTYLQAGWRMSDQATPRDKKKSVVISPGMEATIVDTLKGLFQSSERIKQQYETGTMGLAIGAKWSMDQNVHTQTVGAQGGTPVVSAANQTGSSITSSGWSDSVVVLNQGDVIQFAGVYAVNPMNFQSTSYLANWVVTSNVSSGASGLATIPIAGPSGLGITTTGPFQNASASPANNAAITVNGAGGTVSPRGLMFHEEAFLFASADLPLYEGVHRAERVSDDQLGASIRMITAYDINLDRAPTRTDILYGYAALYPELACRIAS